jgi:hypothetical protein
MPMVGARLVVVEVEVDDEPETEGAVVEVGPVGLCDPHDVATTPNTTSAIATERDRIRFNCRTMDASLGSVRTVE